MEQTERTDALFGFKSNQPKISCEFFIGLLVFMTRGTCISKAVWVINCNNSALPLGMITVHVQWKGNVVAALDPNGTEDVRPTSREDQ